MKGVSDGRGLGRDVTVNRDALMRVALGEEPPDTVVVAGSVFDSVTGEFPRERALWIKDGRIARVASAAEETLRGARVIDASALTLVPGLIDGHTHLIRLFVPEFVRALVPRGVTSVVMETMEYGAANGITGIRPFIDALRDQPLRFFYTAPALCGLTEEEEVAPISSADFDGFLSDPLCLGLGETYWGNALQPGLQGARVRALIARTLAAGKVVEGHTAGAKGARLDAYAALGPSSCHEPISVEEALAVYSRGLFVMLREGGIRRDLERLRPLFDMSLDYRRFALVTDSVGPERLESWGYLDQVVREALELGIAPHIVYRMVGANVAEHFRIDGDLGSLAPGRWADLVAIPSPEEFRPEFVMVEGKTIFDGGEPLVDARPVTVAPELLRTLGLDPDGVLASVGPPPTPPADTPVRVIEYISNLVTREAVLTPEEARGADLVPVLAVERTRGEQAFWGFLKGLGLKEGAFATSSAWDSPDLLVAGRDAVAVRTALRRLVEVGGGLVYVRDDQVVAESPAPVCGVATLDRAERVRADLGGVTEALRDAGVAWEDPILAVDTLTTPAIPHLRITHRGYVRLKDRAVLPLRG